MYLYERVALFKEGVGSASRSENGEQEDLQKSKVKVAFGIETGIRRLTEQRQRMCRRRVEEVGVFSFSFYDPRDASPLSRLYSFFVFH